MDIHGFVIRVTPYKENNSMVTVLTSQGIVSFLARGSMKINSKNATCLILFAETDFEIIESKSGHLSLKVGQVINAHESLFGDLKALASLSLIGEVLNKCVDEENAKRFYDYFNNSIWQLEHQGSPLCVVADFMIQALKEHGLAFAVNECVSCHSQKQIVAFSYLEGGFICTKCYNPFRHKNYGRSYLQAIRYLFMGKDSRTVLREIPLKDGVQIIEELALVWQEQLGVHLLGTDLLFKSLR